MNSVHFILLTVYWARNSRLVQLPVGVVVVVVTNIFKEACEYIREGKQASKASLRMDTTRQGMDSTTAKFDKLKVRGLILMIK